MEGVRERLADLREVLREEHLLAAIVTNADPHNSERVVDHWKTMGWLTGLDGVTGTMVVTQKDAALWTDSWCSADEACWLQDAGVQLMETEATGLTTIAEWLQLQMEATGGRSTEACIDGMCCSAVRVERLKEELRNHGGMTIRTNFDAVGRIWKNRPPLPMEPIERTDMAVDGESTADKLVRVRRALRQQHADGVLLTTLKDVAWILNLRGSDIPGETVFLSYLLIAHDKVTLFVDRRKMSQKVMDYLQNERVGVDDYTHVAKGLENYFEYNILLDPEEVSYELMRKCRRFVVRDKSPVAQLQSRTSYELR